MTMCFCKSCVRVCVCVCSDAHSAALTVTVYELFFVNDLFEALSHLRHGRLLCSGMSCDDFEFFSFNAPLWQRLTSRSRVTLEPRTQNNGHFFFKPKHRLVKDGDVWVTVASMASLDDCHYFDPSD